MSQVIDANAILASAKSKLRSTDVELDGALDPSFDLALLAVFDPNEVLAEDYKIDKEAALQANARKGAQLLINQIFSQPTKATPDGVYATLPRLPTTLLPREKSLPKPKPESKWLKFAKTKGIAPKPKRDRLVFDEEKQDWVPRWGYKGKNKDTEEQWIHEIKNGADPNFDPVKAAKSERKGRKLKNEGQQLKNIERATQASLRAGSSKAPAPALPAGLAALESKDATATGAQASKKADIARLLKATRTSTASLGRFDKTLDKEVAVIGKDAARGQKRKFEPNEVSASDEREGALKMLKTLGHASGGKGKRVGGDEPVVNVRKAIKEVTKGHGVTSMDRGRGRGRGGGRGGATRGSSSSRGSSRGGSSRGGSSRGGGSRGGGRGGKR